MVYVPQSPDVLAEYREAADDSFWQARWQRTDLAQYLARFRDGRLGYFNAPFTKYLPKDRPVLEAGCGRGQYVMALSRRGYDVHGVEYAVETVRAIRSVAPELKIRAGDLRSLEFADGFFGAYISLGVIEHYWDGPDAIMRDAWRVLEKDGTLLLSVPHFNPSLRRLMRDAPAASPAREDFYQFYFSRPAIEERLRGFGFEPIDAFYYDAVYGAKRAFPNFLKLFQRNRPFRAVVSRLNRFAFPQSLIGKFSHMILIVARRR